MVSNTREPACLGLVTGLGMGAGIFYYQEIVSALLALGHPPRLVMAHADVRYVMAQAAAREAQALADYLADILRRLAAAGAEVACIPAFSPQICAAELAAITPVPVISLLDCITAEVRNRNWRRTAIFGTRVTMETKLFGHLNGADVVPASPIETDMVAGTYARIVETAHATPADHTRLRDLAHVLIKRESLDGIVFAGTDLAFVFNPDNTDFPHMDGARLHIAAIVRRLTGKTDSP